MTIESGELEFAPGVYIEQLKPQLPMENRRLAHVNAYLVSGDEEHGALLVDTGWDTDDNLDYFKKALADRAVKNIVVTHAHPDHYGLADRLKHYCHATVCLHQLERDIIQSRYINMDELLQDVAESLQQHGAPAAERDKLYNASLEMRKFVAPALPDVTLYADETISTGHFNFKVIWTPGHSPGHVCLYEPDRKILFSGDHVLPTITPHIGFHPQSGGNPLGDYLAALNRLNKLEVATALPGHEKPFDNFRERVEEIIRHHRQRDALILETLESEAKTAYQIAHEIPWVDDVNGISLARLDPWNRRMAVLETLSHLEEMKAERKVESFSQNEVIYYRRGSGDSGK